MIGHVGGGPGDAGTAIVDEEVGVLGVDNVVGTVGLVNVKEDGTQKSGELRASKKENYFN